MPLTRREQAVMDLYDAGKRPVQIAAALRLAPATVEHIVAKYHGGITGHRAEQVSMAVGSANLLAAMIAAGQTLRPATQGTA